MACSSTTRAAPSPASRASRRSPSKPYVDPTQFDPKSQYYDPKSTRAAPRWVCVDVRALKKTRLMPVAELRAHRALARMWTLRPGNRLSITPVTAAEWKFICNRLS